MLHTRTGSREEGTAGQDDICRRKVVPDMLLQDRSETHLKKAVKGRQAGPLPGRALRWRLPCQQRCGSGGCPAGLQQQRQGRRGSSETMLGHTVEHRSNQQQLHWSTRQSSITQLDHMDTHPHAGVPPPPPVAPARWTACCRNPPLGAAAELEPRTASIAGCWQAVGRPLPQQFPLTLA